MINALGPPVKQKYEPKLPRPVEITAGAAITDGGGGEGRTGRTRCEGWTRWGRLARRKEQVAR